MATARPGRLGSRRAGMLVAALAIALVFPASVGAQPAWKTLEGALVVAHGEDYSKGAPRAVWQYSLRTSTGLVGLDLAGARPEGFLNGAKVRVRGTMAGRTLAVGPNKADRQVTQAVVAAATGARRVAVLLVKFAETDPEPYTVAQAQQVIFSNANSVANYFGEESYGLLSVTGDVFGYYTISTDVPACNYNDIGNKARAAAAAAGVDLSGYTQVQYVHSYISTCGWSGLAYMPGRDSWLNQALNLRVSAHELSHNFGVHHTSTMSCTEGGVRVTLSANPANCSSSEYGDPFSVMGASPSRHTQHQQLASLGWITGADLVTITSSGTYQVGTADDPNAAAPSGVRVARGNGTYLYLELRSPWGSYFDNFSPSDPAVNGVSIRISNDWTSIIQSQLLDTTPGTSTYADAPLAVGSSFFDPISTATITTVSVSGGVATVDVKWGADGVAPSTPGNLAVAATGTNSARLTWSASTDNIGVAGYQVRRDGTLIGTVATTQYNDASLTPGATYQYTVAAVDAAGNASAPASRSWTQPAADTAAPSTPLDFRVTSLTKAKATFAWSASTDNVGVAGYRIYRNGSLVGTVTGLTWSHSRQKTASTYHVVAFDAAGNVSAASASVQVAKK